MAALTGVAPRVAGQGVQLGVPSVPADARPQLVCWPGHSSQITGLALSPDGRTLASVALNEGVLIWDLVTGMPRRGLASTSGPLAISPDGRLLFCLRGGRALLWELAAGRDGRALEQPELKGAVQAGFSSDSSAVAVCCGDGTCVRWELATGRRLAYVKGTEGRKAIVLDADSFTVAYLSRSNNVLVGPVGTGQPLVLRTAERGNVGALALSRGGHYVAASIHPRWDVAVWDTATGELVSELKGWVRGPIGFSPDGRYLVGQEGSGDGTTVWEVATARVVRHLPAMDGSLAFSPDGRWAAQGGRGGDIVVCSLASGSELSRLAAHPDGIRSVAFDPSGRHLMAAAWTAGQTFDLTGGQAVSYRWLNGCNGITFSADGSIRMIVTSQGPQVEDMRSGRTLLDVPGSLLQWQMRTNKTSHPLMWTNCAALSEDCRRVAAGTDEGIVYVWDLPGDGTGRVLEDTTADVESVQFDETGSQLLVAHNDGSVRLLDVATGRGTLLGNGLNIRRAVFSPDCRLVAVVDYPT
ncbi:MAG: hypothetical protein HYU66_14150, partial [Armatimonadetes bacterium]|nr:hypothetical protein [Armatimonadota bacterium]